MLSEIRSCNDRMAGVYSVESDPWNAFAVSASKPPTWSAISDGGNVVEATNSGESSPTKADKARPQGDCPAIRRAISTPGLGNQRRNHSSDTDTHTAEKDLRTSRLNG